MSVSAVHAGHNPLLVALSIAIAVFASYTALDLCSRARSAPLQSKWAWIAGAAAAMGGGIWSMHFVGMLAFEMDMPTAYEPGKTILSLAIAVCFTAAALFFVGRPGSKPRDVLLGGVLMGTGVAAMHYTGMAAMRMPATVAYDGPLVILSIVIAITAATAALRLSFLRHGVWQETRSRGHDGRRRRGHALHGHGRRHVPRPTRGRASWHTGAP